MRKTGYILAVLLAMATCLAGCASFISESYTAKGFTHGNTSDSAFMKFDQFRGNMVFRLEAREGERILYTASLEEGSITTSAKVDGKKEELLR